jgi:ribosomal protein S27AE
VSDEKGKRVECPHPGESYKVAKILKIDESEIFGFPYRHISNPDLYPLLNERVGVISDCICLDCAVITKLDYQQDERKCAECNSSNVLPVDNLEKIECPKCKTGVFVYHHTGIIS